MMANGASASGAQNAMASHVPGHAADDRPLEASLGVRGKCAHG